MFVPFYSTAMLALESCDVINLRLAKLTHATKRT